MNRSRGSQELAVARRVSGIVDALAVIGLALSVIGLTSLPGPVAPRAATGGSLPAARTAGADSSHALVLPPGNPGWCACLIPHHGAAYRRSLGVVSPEPPLAAPPSSAGTRRDRDADGDQDDARAYLRDAAAAAHRSFWAGPGRGETRTVVWVNTSAFIGSTSPPEAGAVNQTVED